MRGDGAREVEGRDSTMVERREGRVRAERGAAAVEFALVVPLLVLLLFGIISYGVMLSFRQTLSQAATEGARAAAVTFLSEDKRDEATAAVDEALSGFGLTCTPTGGLARGEDTVGQCEISDPGTCSPAAAAGVECVTVRLVYDYADHALVPSFPGVGVILPDTLTYSAQARVS